MTQNPAKAMEVHSQFQTAFQTFFSEHDLCFVWRCRLVVRAFTTLAAPVAKNDTKRISTEFAAHFSSIDTLFDMVPVLDVDTLENKVTGT